MAYNRFYIQVIVRVILILASSLLLFYFINKPNRPITIIFFVLLLVYQTTRLIYYVNRTNRDLARFLIYLKEGDTSINITSQKIEKTFKSLDHSFDIINKEIQKLRIEKESKEHFLQILVEHAGVGLIVFNDEGNINIINKTAKELLRINKEKNIRSLKDLCEDFSKVLMELKSNETKLVKLRVNDDKEKNYSEILQISVNAASVKMRKEKIKLIAFQDIKNELEENELESWQKLIRILTHEIMNTMTPVTTLTTTIRRSFKQNKKLKSIKDITIETIQDVLKSTDVIEERSLGLIDFVNNYRSLTRLPKLNITNFQLINLFQDIGILLHDELTKKNILFDFSVLPRKLKFSADKKLVEQVLINIIKNSIEAVNSNEGKIEIISFIRNEKNIIQITDNGTGISEDNIDNVFTPFFTTKEKGTGIGLSLSKQIIRLHKGNISIKSEEGVGTTIELIF